MGTAKPAASLSLDLDNKWSYMKTRGDAGWASLPSYLDIVVPRVLRLLEELGLRITVFVVGQDAALPQHRSLLRSIADAGHEIGNHSFHHEPWLHLYTQEQLEAEISSAEEHIAAATGQRPTGFRGPGYSLSGPLLETLAERGYSYDASTFPTFLGPLARAYYFATARISAEEREQRKRLFGGWKEGFRPIKPYMWELRGRQMLEIPVTTMPFARLPIHLSYLLYIQAFSEAAALAYWQSALLACRSASVEPSFLLHPLDFLDREEVPELAFFPAMAIPSSRKLEFFRQVLHPLSDRFAVTTMIGHAEQIQQRIPTLSRIRPVSSPHTAPSRIAPRHP